MKDIKSPIELKGLIDDVTFDNIDLNLLNSIVNLLFLLDLEVVISKYDLQSKLYLSEKDIDFITDYLVNKDYIKSKMVNEEKIFSLTFRGKKCYTNEIKNLNFLQKFQNSGEIIENINLFSKIPINKLPIEENIPSFIGCFIADKNGKTLLTFEIFEGALDYYLRGPSKKEKSDMNLDLELIPMFISALEKFSEEINIKDLSGLRIKGVNIKLRSFTFEKFTVIFFVNPLIKLKQLEKRIYNYFIIFFNKYKKELELSLQTGYIENISHLNQQGGEMLKELNKFVYLVEFKLIVEDLKVFDIVYARSLYLKLINLYKEFDLKFAITLEKVKQLKINLLKAILNEDLEEFKDIINKTQEIKSSLNDL